METEQSSASTIEDYVRFTAPRAKAGEANQVKGVVLKVDKFGSLITNITPSDVSGIFGGEFKITVGNATVTKLVSQLRGRREGRSLRHPRQRRVPGNFREQGIRGASCPGEQGK